MKRSTIVVLSLVCVATSGAQTTAGNGNNDLGLTTSQSSNSATQTGTRIGTVVSSAIETALPVVGKVLDLFRNNPNKKNASKDEVSTSVSNAQRAFEATVKQKIQPVATVAKELTIIQNFAAAAVNANENIIKINDLLKTDQAKYDDVDTEWTIAKNYLADIITIKAEDLNSVADPVIRLRLSDLQSSRKDLMVRIDKNIAMAKAAKQINKSDLQIQISAMASLLKGLNSLAAIEFSSLAADISDLSKWANAAQGISETVPKPNEHLLMISDTAAKAAREALSSTAIPE